MDSVTNLSDPSAKSGLAANLLASLSASLASGDPVDGLFADFLSQIQTLPPPPPNPPATAPQPASSPSAPQSSQQPDQDAETNNAPAVTATTAANAPDTNTPATPPGWTFIGKSQRHDTKSATDKNASQDTANNQSSPSPPSPPPVPVGNGQTGLSNTTPAPVVPIAAVAANDPADTADAGSDPVNTTVPVTNLNQGTNVPAIAAPAKAAPSTTDASSPLPANGGDDVSDTANSDVTASQLMLLLMQLERLAAGRLAGMPTTASQNAANTVGAQNTNAAATLSAPGTASDTQGKIDLKTLLAELTGRNNPDLAGDSTIGQAGTGTSDSTQDATGTSAAVSASLQNTVQTSTTTTSSAAATNDKWMNASFLDLFNLAANNQNNTGIPFVFNPGTGAVSPPAGSDGAALDTDLQDEGGANTHSPATEIQTLNTNLPSTAGPSQAASPYDFASQLSAMRAAKGGPTGLPTPVEQVVLQLSRGLSKDGSSQMTIQLRPAELGRVDVKLNIGSDGKVQGTVTADNPATLGLLLKDVRGLERALQEAGLRADSGSLQFNLRGDGQPGGTGGQTTDNQSGFTNNANTSSGSAIPLAAFADPAETYYLTPGGVNFRV